MTTLKLAAVPNLTDSRPIQQFLLPIIIVYQFVKIFEKNQQLDLLKKVIEDFNKIEGDKKGKRTYSQGGSSSVDQVRAIRIEDLKVLYNDYLDVKLTPQKQTEFFEQAEPIFKIGSGNKITRINRFEFCQRFLETIFPDYYQFSVQIHPEIAPTGLVAVATASPETFENVNAFIKSRKKLNDVTVVSTNSWVLKKKLLAASGVDTWESYLAFYPLKSRRITQATVLLGFSPGRSQLVKVRLSQREDFITSRPLGTPHEFEEQHICQAKDGSLFLTLRVKSVGALPEYLQITLEAQVDNQYRGAFSTSVRLPDSETLSLTGRFTLVRQDNQSTSLPDGQEDQIRYQLQNKLILETNRLQTKLSTSQLKWARLAGKYECTYIRLTLKTLQYSYIELFADGRATLHQHYTDAMTTGWGRLTTNKVGKQMIWLYFGYSDELGQGTLRYLLDVTDGDKTLKGVFSSESLFFQQIVSGRILMRKMDPEPSVWPPTSIDIPYKNVRYSHLLNKEDLAFFTGRPVRQGDDVDFKNMTDGPYWAEIARRLTFPSALTELEKFFGVMPENQLPELSPDSDPVFPDGSFYYYTFKQEDESKQFLIERNVIRFRRSGRVTIETAHSNYEGYAYYWNNTLKISFLDTERGFLDAYFTIRKDDVTDSSASIRVLYGASLWKAGLRIQAKTVILSRLKAVDDDSTSQTIKFLNVDHKDFETEAQKLILEEEQSAGVVSYLRGERNRFHLSTINAPSNNIRPRDSRSRALHFLIASYYGLRLRALDVYTSAERLSLIQEATENLFLAYVYGYATNFAGLKIVAEWAVNDPVERVTDPTSYIAMQYKKRFPTANLRDTRMKDVLVRIREGAQEQIDLKEAFGPGGIFHLPELLAVGRKLWPNLV